MSEISTNGIYVPVIGVKSLKITESASSSYYFTVIGAFEPASGYNDLVIFRYDEYYGSTDIWWSSACTICGFTQHSLYVRTYDDF